MIRRREDERKMPKNLGHIESLARPYTDTAIKTLAGIMMDPSAPARARSDPGSIRLRYDHAAKSKKSCS
jgi:hypothetical protein